MRGGTPRRKRGIFDFRPSLAGRGIRLPERALSITLPHPENPSKVAAATEENGVMDSSHI
ncbi:hypothetical protein GCM10017635_28660 [Paracoccus kondratievae]|uniref:Uncharacterized protein n=1 Tax=Paracoccus kondratievae TaxID=135740 RepID=A0AAD3P154_9RHOB|nr:hypothetical protein GCM10017635_28660 [Paracoccus kondratievae]